MAKPIYCDRTNKLCFGDTELPLLFEISRMINNSRFIKEALNPIMELVATYMDAERSLLSILNREVSSIFIEAGYGISNDEKKQGRYLVGEGVTGQVIKTGEAVYIKDTNNAPGFANKTNIRLKYLDKKNLSFFCVPIRVDESVVGTLSIVREYSPGTDREEIMRLLSVIGSMIAQAVRVRQDRMEEIDRLSRENDKLQNALQSRDMAESIIGNSSGMREVFTLIRQVSKTQATVLIRGESGVGKELIADAIHEGSPRRKKPLVKINCSALPESLIESELFGHEKGAFTGADAQKKGRFELAEGGSIFLDEIGELPIHIQVKLLRVLQERKFERVGGITTISSDVRIITATNRDLEKSIEDNSFREDLYYRLNVFPVFIPSLRERRNDIPLLVDHFIQKANRKNGTDIIRISSSALEMLLIYNWPGNIRELENCIERAAIVSDDRVIRSQHLPPTLQTAQSSGTGKRGTLQVIVDKVEKQLIVDSLTRKRGNVFQSARELGISNRKLGLRIEKYKLDVSRFKL